MNQIITDTLRGTKVVMETEGNEIGMYVCGPTVYDYCHLGHARAYITFDTIRRFLIFSGYKVKYVQNFTDVDDKIINKANETGVPPLQLSENFIREYFDDMDRLNIMRADVHPKVSEHIEDIISFIEDIIEKGYAYESDGDVYFEVKKLKTYGKLSKQNMESIIAGARIDPSEKKRNPEDFALWKSAKPGEIYWDSPWGKGRPGWHIECSVMSTKYLGNSFTIHGGGMDLIFPHHENEIAQAEARNGTGTFAKYWIHNGFVTIRKEKMSKSLKNFTTLRDFYKKYEPMVLRFYFLQTHYRNPIDFDLAPIEEASENYRKIMDTLGKLEQCNGEGIDISTDIKNLEEAFMKAMKDDFNTRLAIMAIQDIVKKANKNMALLSKGNGLKLYHHIKKYMDVLGLIKEENDESKNNKLVFSLVNLLIDIRNDARKNKDWATADRIRDELKKMGIVLEDGKGGTKFRIDK